MTIVAFNTPAYCSAFLRRLDRHVDVLYKTVAPAAMCSGPDEEARFMRESDETTGLIEAFGAACEVAAALGLRGHVPVASMNAFIARLAALESYTKEYL